jgi:hypothetical protein
MPNIDITELLEDEDFATTFAVVRKSTEVGQNGRNVTTETRYDDVVGVIAPVTSKTLRDNPDLRQQPGVIECWTRFLLQGAAEGASPDAIEWEGDRYNVQQLTDWGQWGSGWRHAVAIRAQPIPRGDGQ